MKNFELKTTKSTPSVKIDVKKNYIKIKGKSYPENSYDFYTPIIKIIKELLSKNNSPLTVTLHLVYINTSSAKSLMNIFDIFEESKNDINITWLYDSDNEMAKESGIEFKEDLTIPFDIKPVVK